MHEQQSVGLTFVNYTYAFNSFYDQYKELCIKISENSDLKSFKDIRKAITTFIYENEYAIDNRKKQLIYERRLYELKKRADQDASLKAAIKKDLDYTANKIFYRRKYYEYFIEYLEILGQFVSELSATYMPNTNIQRKLLKYVNNQMFFEKFTQHKEKVVEALNDFDLRDFTKSYNILVTFYFAYSLFINEQDKSILNKMFSYALTYYLSEDILSLIAKQDPSSNQISKLSRVEFGLHKVLLFCLSVMNQSFSNFDVLPKLRSKVYIDKTLI